ncbi:NUDIX hydrolase domain-like protein [Zopfochytrium polystomum]|nr:NUDIX hydrolase domain-like protein [Zopfochytrium polystomum]
MSPFAGRTHRAVVAAAAHHHHSAASAAAAAHSLLPRSLPAASGQSSGQSSGQGPVPRTLLTPPTLPRNPTPHTVAHPFFFLAAAGAAAAAAAPSTLPSRTRRRRPSSRTPKTVANRLNVDVEEKVYKNPASTVDALVVRKNAVTGDFEILCVQRGRNPYQYYWALPGGFIEYGEDPELAVRRELEEESKLIGLPGEENVHLITVRGAGNRDPRQHIITIAYAVRVDPSTLPLCAGSDDARNLRPVWSKQELAPSAPRVNFDARRDAKWLPLDKAGSSEFPLAFDHSKIEGITMEYYVVDENPKQPGETSAAGTAVANKL